MSDPGSAVVDIVDDDDVTVGTATRREMRSRRLLHRCCAVLVLGSDDRLLVHQRAPTKDVWPSRWDLCAGGVIEHGEGLEQAATRELQEELGITAELVKLGSARHRDPDVDVFMHVWLVRHDGPFTFTDGEVARVRWVTPTELDHLLHVHEWCTDSVGVALPMLRQVPGWRA